MGKLKKSEGELVYLIASFAIGMYLYLFVSFMVISSNNIHYEYCIREISNRISLKSKLRDITSLKEEINIQAQTFKTNNRYPFLREILNYLIVEEFLETDDYKIYKLYSNQLTHKIIGLIPYKPKIVSYIYICKNF